MSGVALRYPIDIARAMGMSIMLVRVIPQLLDILDMSYWTAAKRMRVKRLWSGREKEHMNLNTRNLKSISP
jgi:hypothetical protein